MSTNYDLKDFFSSYFHEDWSLDDDSSIVVVERFLRDYGPSSEVEVVVRGLRTLLASEETEEHLGAKLLHEYGCYFDPGLGGRRTWIEQIADMLEKDLDRHR